MSSPNDAAKAGRNKEADNPVAPCPLMKKAVQLIPLRYGLVERLSPTDIKLPYKTESKPLGIRLLRDGWLYIVVGDTADAILHEYRIENGMITQLLWSQNEVSADIRNQNVGEASLIFEKKALLFATYSELQWTAAKCAQVIKSPIERKHFMQSVSLSGVNAVKGAKNLLTPIQAQTWLAEASEQASTEVPPQGAFDDEFTDYAWEHKALFSATLLDTLKGTVNCEHENDYLYLVLNDDIGVLRDLASHQDLVVGWISQWAENKTVNQQYAEGCYIETQLEMTPEDIDNSPLLTNSAFENAKTELTATHKEAIADWIALKQQGDDINEEKQFAKLKQLLGPELADKYEPLILDLEQTHDESLNGVPWWKVLDENVGALGIKDVITQTAMEAFLTQQREHLARWDQRLDLITQDRINFLDKFYQSAWYFDPNQSQQVLEALSTEYSCIKDICRTDKATEMVTALFNDKPWLIYPAFYTLPLANSAVLQEQILTKIKEIKISMDAEASVADVNNISVQLNGLVSNDLHTMGLINGVDEAVTHFHQINHTVYSPVHQLALAGEAQTLFNGLNQSQNIDPNKILRNLPNATWLSVLAAHESTGTRVEFATKDEVKAFKADSAEALRLRQKNTSLKNLKRETRKQIRTKGKTQQRLSRIAELDNEFRSNQARLAQLEPALAKNMTPLGDGPSRVGFKLTGLSAPQLNELKLLAQDQSKKVNTRLFPRDMLAGLSVLIAFYQLNNARTVVSSYFTEGSKVSVANLGQSLSSALGASFGAAQALYAARDMAALKAFTSASQQLAYGASLGRMTGILGAFTYFYSGISSIIKASSAIVDLLKGYQSGNQALILKSALNLGAESSLTAINGVALARTMVIVQNVLKSSGELRAIAWAANSGKLLSIGIRANLLGIAVSALQLAGTVWYNRSQLNDYLRWVKTSSWGIAPSGDSLAQGELALARIVAKPSIEFKVVDKGAVLVVSMPGCTARELNQADIKLAAYWQIDLRTNTWEPWSHELSGQWRLLSGLEQPLTLGLPIYPNEQNAQHNIAIELHYRPSVHSDDVEIIRFQTSQLNQSQQLTAVKMFKTAQLNAPLVALNYDSLTGEALNE
ncbi:hypothetical protein HQQ94_07125 [Shewanella sp. VB17]|uniref:toxin VasX n=1 Tax=Shewanella sp. VB17 TaxID=2739432 RepID=UPI0015641D10|nr:toxin VasX [Shewanella sp. VB17]NRD73014.1 hypothetical protein [Shewanella sp. VB17]